MFETTNQQSSSTLSFRDLPTKHVMATWEQLKVSVEPSSIQLHPKQMSGIWTSSTWPCPCKTCTKTKKGDQTTISFNMFQQLSFNMFQQLSFSMVQDLSLRLTKLSHSKRRTAVPAAEEEEGCTGLTASSA